MPDPTLPLPTEPIPHGQQSVPPAVDPFEDATFAAYEPPRPPAVQPPAGPAPAPHAPAPQPAAAPPVPVPQPPSASAPVAQPAPVVTAAPVLTPAPPPPIISRIGEISVSATTIYTPTGEMPLKRSQWVVSEQWQAHTKIPTWAIIMCVFTFFCIPFVNFLFLLAKETYYTGTAAVSVAGAGRHYTARIPVKNQNDLANLHSQVNYVRSLAAL